jgi:hypothetical protein
MGLKLEYNTRRFVTDDRRELQYRVEVQNRVYRKEMATLDAEIAKLEELLENRSSSTSSSQISVIPHIKVEYHYLIKRTIMFVSFQSRILIQFHFNHFCLLIA